MTDAERAINEDLTIGPGTGVTESVGSDSYPFYVSEVLPNRVIGLYPPSSHFEKSWTDGHQVVDKFDANMPSKFYIKRRYGNWWQCTKDGKPLRKWGGRYNRISFGHAYSYQDPSF